MSNLGRIPNGFNQVSRSAVAITVDGIDQALITTASFTMYDGLTVSQSINAFNINAGNPTSNQWQTNLTGSYFNNFTTQTDVSEILRFVAGLLSQSAPDASPNTKTYSTYTANGQNTGSGTVIAGSVPQSSTNTTITYLTSKGFANTGSTLFNSITPIYTAVNYGYTYTSVAAGSTLVSSSADAQLFGLGLLSSGNATSFSVSGSFTFRFKDNSARTDTATSASQALIVQTGTGSTSGVSLAKILTVNPNVIPPAYQDGKYASTFSNLIFSGSSAPAVSSSGYYHISASIQIASGSSGYTTPIQNNNEIFFAPLTTISASVPSQTPATGSTTVTALTAVSRSLSGAPYLSGSTYNLSSSFTNLFNPLYYVGTIASLSTVSTGMTQTSGVTSSLTTAGLVSTAGSVFDSTGVTVRATSTIPFETDVVKLNGLYTFGSANTNIAQTSFTPTTFTVSIAGVNKAASTTTYATSSNYHTAGTFGQPVASGSLAYNTRTQGADTGTVLNEPFTGESYRIQLADNVLAFNGTAWDTTFQLYNLGATDLQVKPGYLVKPGGTYGYWLANPSSASDYKYYIRKFTVSPAATKTSMTLNLGQALVNWGATTNNSVAAAILFESSKNTVYTPARIYDPSNLNDNFTATKTANTDGQNPFGANFDLYGNTGGSLATTTYTIPLRSADGMNLNATYDELYVLVRYKGDPTPLSTITVTFA